MPTLIFFGNLGKAQQRDKGHPVLLDPGFARLNGGTGYGCQKARRAMDENCKRIKRLLELYREGRLNDEQKADVEYHLLYCPECIFLLTLVPSLGAD